MTFAPMRGWANMLLCSCCWTTHCFTADSSDGSFLLLVAPRFLWKRFFLVMGALAGAPLDSSESLSSPNRECIEGTVALCDVVPFFSFLCAAPSSSPSSTPTLLSGSGKLRIVVAWFVILRSPEWFPISSSSLSSSSIGCFREPTFFFWSSPLSSSDESTIALRFLVRPALLLQSASSSSSHGPSESSSESLFRFEHPVRKHRLLEGDFTGAENELSEPEDLVLLCDAVPFLNLSSLSESEKSIIAL
mmetsp:Transcript_1100/g.2759  ORF Transcript_1100/g.2759 Transcript_1100/m.2759 type:complete len:247 (-) Transcript_1100:465-1205(-)